MSQESGPNNKDKAQDRRAYHAQYYEENKARIAAQRKAARLAKKEEINAAERSRYANDPAFRVKKITSSVESKKKLIQQSSTDPEAMKLREERLARRRMRHKERMRTDPAYRERCRSYAANASKKRRKNQKNEGDEP